MADEGKQEAKKKIISIQQKLD